MQAGKFQPPYYGVANLKYEKLVSNNIKHIKADILYMEHNIGDLSNKFTSQKLLETMRNKLDNVFSLISVTDGYLMEWELQIQKSPILQHTTENFESISAQFKRAVSRAQKVSELIEKQSALQTTDPTDDSTVDASIGSLSVDVHFINDAKSDMEYEEQLIPISNVGEQQYLLPPSKSILQTRTEGIRNIRDQIKQAKGIFKDLATIVTIQDEGLERMEANTKEAYQHTQDAVADIESLAKSRNKSLRCKYS